MRREEFPVGRPDWENVIIEEGLTYSVDGPHDTDHYWNEYAAYIFSPQEMDSVRAQACLLYTSPSPRDLSTSRMPSSA